MKWYPRDPHRALDGMTGLTLEERGAYGTIIDASYARDAGLPDDNSLLCCMLNCHGNKWRGIRQRLISKGKIKISEGFIIPNGVEKVRKEVRNFSETQRKRVGKRWEKYKNANENNDSADTKAVIPIHTQTQTHKSLNGHKRGLHSLPSDWHVPERAIEEASKLKVDWRIEAPKFKDYWLSKGKKFSDWDAAFCNWIRKAAEFAEKGKPKKSQHWTEAL